MYNLQIVSYSKYTKSVYLSIHVPPLYEYNIQAKLHPAVVSYSL